MKSYRVSKSYTIFWGLTGLWILLGGTIFSLFSTSKLVSGFLFIVGLFVAIYLLVTGRATKKREYSELELTQRGILLLMIIILPSVIAFYRVAARPYLIPFVAVIVILLVLMVLELRKAERISIDQ